MRACLLTFCITLRTNASSSIDVVRDDPAQQRKTSVKPLKAKPGRPRTKAAAPGVSSSASASGSRTPVGEDWMLDCEICHRSGVNKVNGYAEIPSKLGFAHTWKLQDDGSPLYVVASAQSGSTSPATFWQIAKRVVQSATGTRKSLSVVTVRTAVAWASSRMAV